MNKAIRLLIAIIIVLSAPFNGMAEEAVKKKIYIIQLKGTVNPGMAGFFHRSLQEATKHDASCLIVELDTPGGLVTTLREMVQEIMSSPIPVVVYVSPSGAQAASAGTLLLLSAHIAAMASGTNTGAAHPIVPGQDSKKDEVMGKKMESDVAAFARSIAQERGRNVEWAEKAVRESVSATDQEALKLGVIDLISKDSQELIQKLNGMEVKLGKKKKRLKWDSYEIIRVEPNLREKALLILGDPNIAYILMMIGLTGLYFELANPGSIFPGTVGAISLILALYALHTLSANITGILLIFLAAILLILELFITSYGILGISGLISLIIGSIMLFESPYPGVTISRDVLWSTIAITTLFFLMIVYVASRAVFSRPKSGKEALIGERGIVQETLGPKGGKVFIHGEIWNAFSDDEIPEGKEVEVTAVSGLKIKVKKSVGGLT